MFKWLAACFNASCMRQPFHFLPVPESHEAVLLPDGSLPLEYIDSAWQLLVCCGANPPEYIFTNGKGLHRNWESSYLYHYGHSITPIGALKIVCPDMKNLAVKILDYGESAKLGAKLSSKSSKKTNARETTLQ
jgi:hypothetical protein